jgi:hypothetical protein
VDVLSSLCPLRKVILARVPAALQSREEASQALETHTVTESCSALRRTLTVSDLSKDPARACCESQPYSRQMMSARAEASICSRFACCRQRLLAGAEPSVHTVLARRLNCRHWSLLCTLRVRSLSAFLVDTHIRSLSVFGRRARFASRISKVWSLPLSKPVSHRVEALALFALLCRAA